MVDVIVDVIVDEIGDFYYIFVDKFNNHYRVLIEFIDVSIKVGDRVFLPSLVLREENIFTYGPIYDDNSSEYIKVMSDGKEYYLERYFG